MPLSNNSRYRVGENGEKITATKITINGSDKIFLHDRKTFSDIDMKGNIKIREVKTRSEFLDLIAHEEGGDERKWWLIADINELFYPDEELAVGDLLKIPSLEDFQSV